MCVCVSSKLSLLSVSYLFSRLSECVSLHWPFFRSYWEMAAPLKFNPLSHHTTTREGERTAKILRQAYTVIQECIQPQIWTHTTTHTLNPTESVRCDSKRWGVMERKILHRWKVKNKMEQITAWKPHTRTFDAEAAMEMNGISSAGEMEIWYRSYVPSLRAIHSSKPIFPIFLLLSHTSAQTSRSL